MSDQKEPHENSSNSALAFIVGGLVVAVGIIAWVVYGGGAEDAGTGAGNDGDVNVEINGGDGAADAVEDAADSVGDAAEDMGDAAQDATDGDANQ